MESPRASGLAEAANGQGPHEIGAVPEPQAARPVEFPGGWTYRDALYLLLFSFPALIVASVACMAVFHGIYSMMGWEVVADELSGKAPLVVAIQLVWWILLLGFIYAVVTVKYRLPFGRAIGWTRPERPASMYFAGGVLLALSVAILAHFVPMPTEKLPIEELLRDRFSLMVLAFFGVLIAPAIEELVFRGFLFPVVERSHGPLVAVVATSALFSLVHAQQYGWHWQNLTMLLYVGIVFGTVRAKTRSLLPSTLMHAAYNATLFVGLFAAGDQLYKP